MLVEETDNREVPRLINGDYELEKDNKYCEWLQLSNGEFMPSSKIITVKELAAGVYDINYSPRHDELIFTRKNYLWMNYYIFQIQYLIKLLMISSILE